MTNIEENHRLGLRDIQNYMWKVQMAQEQARPGSSLNSFIYWLVLLLDLDKILLSKHWPVSILGVVWLWGASSQGEDTNTEVWKMAHMDIKLQT